MKTFTPNSISDQALLQELQHGGNAGFDRIYDLYYPIMFNHALRMLKDVEDARDVVQELFINLHQKKKELTDGTSVGKFLYFTLRNLVLNQIRNEKTYTSYLENYRNFADQHQHDILDILYEKDLQEIIDKEVARLPPRMKEVYELSRKEFLSYKEIGDKLNISEQTVKTQMKNALRILRMRMPVIMIVIPVLKSILQRFG